MGPDKDLCLGTRIFRCVLPRTFRRYGICKHYEGLKSSFSVYFIILYKIRAEMNQPNFTPLALEEVDKTKAEFSVFSMFQVS